MKKILFSCLLITCSLVSWTQTKSSDESIKSEDIQKTMDEAMKEFQGAMDTLDLSQFFSGDLSKMFGDSTMQSFDFSQMEGMLEGIDMNELFGPDMQIQMEQSLKMLEGMDMDQINSLLEGIDMSQLEGMLEGFDMGEMQKMFEGMDMQIPEIKEIEPADKKSKKTKKI